MNEVKTGLTLADPVKDTAGKAHEGVNNAADKVNASVDRLRDAAHQTVDQVAQRAAAAGTWASENVDHLKQKQAEFTDAASSMISSRPFVAVGTALVIGYLLGRLSR